MTGIVCGGYYQRKPACFSMSKSRKFQAQFVDSVFSLEQMPRDRRPQIAIAGRSNVGKSSLLNRLLGSRKMAKVSSTPGKTRSLNFFLIDEAFYIVDLPGYGYAKVSRTMKAQWRKLIEGYLTKGEHLIGLLFLLDCRRELTNEDLILIGWLAERQLPVLVALTKADKLNRSRLAAKITQVEEQLGCDVIASSAVSGTGKQALIDAVRTLVVQAGKN